MMLFCINKGCERNPNVEIRL